MIGVDHVNIIIAWSVVINGLMDVIIINMTGVCGNQPLVGHDHPWIWSDEACRHVLAWSCLIIADHVLIALDHRHQGLIERWSTIGGPWSYMNAAGWSITEIYIRKINTWSMVIMILSILIRLDHHQHDYNQQLRIQRSTSITINIYYLPYSKCERFLTPSVTLTNVIPVAGNCQTISVFRVLLTCSHVLLTKNSHCIKSNRFLIINSSIKSL